MQALPTHMILPDAILTSIEGGQLIPVEHGGRFVQKTIQGLSIAELGKRLLKAAKDGNTEQVRDLMSKGAPFTTDWLGTSPLHYAAINNHLETCKVLLRAGISRDSRTKVERTPLHMAAYEGHINIVETLLQNGAAIDSLDMLKMTPLHWAVQNGHLDVITLLLRNGANPHLLNKFDRTPIDIALETNRADILQLLQIIKRDTDLIDTTDSLSMDLESEERDQVINHEDKLPDRHFLDQDDIEESTSNLAESLETVQEEVQQQNITNINFTDSIQILKEHGISFLPTDNSSVVASAVENGHSLVLTEVGKQVLNSTKPLVRVPMSRQKANITKINGRPIITIRPDQLIALSNSNKKQQNRFPLVLNKTQKPFKRVVMNKNGILYSTDSNFTNVAKRVKLGNDVIQAIPSTSPSDLELVQKQLAEARKEAEEYKQMLKRKEAEAEKYKRQLQSITQSK